MNADRLVMPLCVALILAGCAGTTLDTDSIMSRSTSAVLPPEMRTANPANLALPEQHQSNVKVFEERPEFSYFVVDTFHTTFDYEKDYVKYRKIEQEKHLKELRARAGRLGANGVIVVFGWDEKYSGGATSYDMLETPGRDGRPGFNNVTPYQQNNLDVVSSDKVTTVQVTSYAIYRETD